MHVWDRAILLGMQALKRPAVRLWDSDDRQGTAADSLTRESLGRLTDACGFILRDYRVHLIFEAQLLLLEALFFELVGRSDVRFGLDRLNLPF